MSSQPYHDEVRVLRLATDRGEAGITDDDIARSLLMPARTAKVRRLALIDKGCLREEDGRTFVTLVGRAELEDREAAIQRGETRAAPSRRRSSKQGDLTDPSAQGYVGTGYTVGSDTSRQAAEEILSVVEIVRGKVYRLLAEAGPEGLLHHDLIAALPQYEPSTVRTRCDELVKAGLVEDSGIRRRSRSNKPCTVWRLIEVPADLVKEAS